MNKVLHHQPPKKYTVYDKRHTGERTSHWTFQTGRPRKSSLTTTSLVVATHNQKPGLTTLTNNSPTFHSGIAKVQHACKNQATSPVSCVDSGQTLPSADCLIGQILFCTLLKLLNPRRVTVAVILDAIMSDLGWE